MNEGDRKAAASVMTQRPGPSAVFYYHTEAPTREAVNLPPQRLGSSVAVYYHTEGQVREAANPPPPPQRPGPTSAGIYYRTETPGAAPIMQQPSTSQAPTVAAPAAGHSDSEGSPPAKKRRNWKLFTPKRRELVTEFREESGKNRTQGNGTIGSEVWVLKLCEYIQNSDPGVALKDVYRWINNNRWIIQAPEPDAPKVAQNSAPGISARMVANEAKMQEKARQNAIAIEAAAAAKAAAAAARAAAKAAKGTPKAPPAGRNQSLPVPRKLEDEFVYNENLTANPAEPQLPEIFQPAASSLTFSGILPNSPPATDTEPAPLPVTDPEPKLRPRVAAKKSMGNESKKPAQPRRQYSRGKTMPASNSSPRVTRGMKRNADGNVIDMAPTNPQQENACEAGNHNPNIVTGLNGNGMPKPEEEMLVDINDLTKCPNPQEDLKDLQLARNEKQQENIPLLISPPGSPPSTEYSNFMALAGCIKSVNSFADGMEESMHEDWSRSNWNIDVKTEASDFLDEENDGSQQMQMEMEAANAPVAAPAPTHVATSYSVEGPNFPPTDLTYVSSGYHPTPEIPIDLSKFPIIKTETQAGDAAEVYQQISTHEVHLGSLPDTSGTGQMQRYAGHGPSAMQPRIGSSPINIHLNSSSITSSGFGSISPQIRLRTPGNFGQWRPRGDSYGSGVEVQKQRFELNTPQRPPPPPYGFGSAPSFPELQHMFHNNYCNGMFNELPDLADCLISAFCDSQRPSTSNVHYQPQPQRVVDPPKPQPLPLPAPSPKQDARSGSGPDYAQLLGSVRQLQRVFDVTPGLSVCRQSFDFIIRELGKCIRSSHTASASRGNLNGNVLVMPPPVLISPASSEASIQVIDLEDSD